MHYDRDGRFQLRYSAPATIGALVEQAAQGGQGRPVHRSSRAERRSEATGADAADGPRHRRDGDRPTYADALAEIAQRSLSAVTSTSRASHYRVYLHLATDGAWVNGGGAIPPGCSTVPLRRRRSSRSGRPRADRSASAAPCGSCPRGHAG